MKISTDARLPQTESLQALKQRLYEIHRETATLLNSAVQRGEILGTVSQSAGAPTGAIIEAGTNANGTYTKFADGTLICSKATGSIAAVVHAASGALYLSPSVAAGSWAAAFTSFTGIAVSGTNNLGNGWIGMAVFPTITSAGSYVSVATTAVNTPWSAWVTGIGRWF